MTDLASAGTVFLGVFEYPCILHLDVLRTGLVRA